MPSDSHHDVKLLFVIGLIIGPRADLAQERDSEENQLLSRGRFGRSGHERIVETP